MESGNRITGPFQKKIMSKHRLDSKTGEEYTSKNYTSTDFKDET